MANKSNGHVDTTWTAPNGLKVQLIHVSPFLVRAAGNKVKMPDVPTIFNEDKGREEENPLDPNYADALAKAQEERALAIYGAFVMLGTKIVSAPPDMIPYDSDEWLELVTTLTGEEIPTHPGLRRMVWMKYIALNSMEALRELLSTVVRFNKFVTEKDVEAAEDAFRSETGRDADTGVDTPEAD